MVVTTFAFFKVGMEGKGDSSRTSMAAQVGILFYFWLVLGGWYLVGYLQTPATIHIENASNRQVEIELDGRPWRTSDPEQLQQAEVRPGQYQITVYPHGGGPVLQKLEVRVERNAAYILNVLSAQTYYRGSVQYGGVIGFGTKEPVELKHEWIDVAGVDFLFQNPPRSITVKVQKGMEGLTWETKTYVTRGAPPPAEKP